jgi:hypothetical protein
VRGLLLGFVAGVEWLVRGLRGLIERRRPFGREGREKMAESQGIIDVLNVLRRST